MYINRRHVTMTGHRVLDGCKLLVKCFCVTGRIHADACAPTES